MVRAFKTTKSCLILKKVLLVGYGHVCSRQLTVPRLLFIFCQLKYDWGYLCSSLGCRRSDAGHAAFSLHGCVPVQRLWKQSKHLPSYSLYLFSLPVQPGLSLTASNCKCASQLCSFLGRISLFRMCPS